MSQIDKMELNEKADLIKRARLWVVVPPKKEQLIQVEGFAPKIEKLSVTDVIDELELNVIHYQKLAATFETELLALKKVDA